MFGTDLTDSVREVEKWRRGDMMWEGRVEVQEQGERREVVEVATTLPSLSMSASNSVTAGPHTTPCCQVVLSSQEALT